MVDDSMILMHLPSLNFLADQANDAETTLPEDLDNFVSLGWGGLAFQSFCSLVVDDASLPQMITFSTSPVATLFILLVECQSRVLIEDSF